MVWDLYQGRQLVLSGGASAWLALALAILALLLLGILYREERRLVPRGAGLSLLGLRGLVALILASFLLEPTLSRTARQTVRGVVLVGVDLSASMDQNDPDRDPDQAQRLKDQLGLNAGGNLESMSRRLVVADLLRDDWLARLRTEHALELVGFHRDLVPSNTTELVAALIGNADPSGDSRSESTSKAPSHSAADTSANPDGNLLDLDDPEQRVARLSTDLSQVLQRGLADRGDAPPVQALVLISDGQHNGPTDLDAWADRLIAADISVHGVLVGSVSPPRDAAVVRVRAPATGLQGDRAQVEAIIKADGLDGTPVTVVLERPDAEPLRQTISGSPDGRRQRVLFRVPLDRVGALPLTVRVSAPGRDQAPDNDEQSTQISVLDAKVATLLIEERPRWEFRYHRNALGRDDRVDLEVVLTRQPELPSTGGTTIYPRTIPEAIEDEDPLDNYDVIVVGDVALDGETWRRLERFVAERGGTLVLMAGPQHGPSAMRANEDLSALLPIRDPRPIATSSTRAGSDPLHPALIPGIAVRPSALALEAPELWPMFQFAGETSRNALIWAGLPRQSWALVGPVKPGATALIVLDAFGPDEPIDPSEPASVSPTFDTPPRAAVAAQTYGRGKVFYVGLSQTWRWRHRVGDAYHHRFWGQVVRWGAIEPLGAGNRKIRYGPLTARIEAGRPATIEARIRDPLPDDQRPNLIIARIDPAQVETNDGEPAPVDAGSDASSNSSGKNMLVPLRPDPQDPGRYVGVSGPLATGRFDVRLDAPDWAEAWDLTGPDGPSPAPLEVIAPSRLERVELVANPEPLETLALATGGIFVRADEIDQVPKAIRTATREAIRTEREQVPLWDQPATLLVLLVLITLEWVLRRRFGLV